MRYVQIGILFLIFGFVISFFSPWYLQKRTEVTISYMCDDAVKISVANDYRGHLMNEDILLFRDFTLPAATEWKTVTFRVPTVPSSSNARGIRIAIGDNKSLTIGKLEVKGRKKSYTVNWENDLLARGDVTISDSKITATGDVLVMFPDIIRIKRDFRWGIFTVAFVVAAAVTALVFFRVKKTDNLPQLLFVVGVLALMLFPMLRLDILSIVSNENRRFQEFPEISGEFPKKFESYLSDRFCGREEMINWNRKIFDVKFSQDGNSLGEGKAFYGKEGWMFSRIYDSVNIAQNKNLFTEDELKTCAKNVNVLCDVFEKRFQAPVFVVLMPDKERIYEEYYPNFLLKQRVGTLSRLEQLTAYLQQHSRAVVVAPLSVLREKKTEGILYYPGGTHQTPLGGYFSAQEIRKALLTRFPNLPEVAANISAWEPGRKADVDIANLMGLTAADLNDSYIVFDTPKLRTERTSRNIRDLPMASLFINRHTAKTADHNELRVLAVTDSFWGVIQPCLSHIISDELHIFYGEGRDFSFSTFVDELESFKPQAVIIESTERFLSRFLTINPEE